MRKHLEDDEMQALFEWAEYVPELGLMFHIPNGGRRNPREAARFKRMGVKAGVPDIFLPLPRGRYSGLWIELKARQKGRTSENQERWIVDLIEAGYDARVCHGWEQAKTTIEAYLCIKT